MPFFFNFIDFSFHTYNTFTHSYPWKFAEAPLHSIIAEQLSGPPWGAESESESQLGPAFQRSDVLPIELRHTLLSHAAHWLSGRTPLSHAAP